MPDVPPPDGLPELGSYYNDIMDRLPTSVRRILGQKRPFEFRPTETPGFLRAEKSAPSRHIWFRAVAALPDDETLHRCLLAYVSDFNLLDTARPAWTSGCSIRPTVRARREHAALPAATSSPVTGG
jgi:acyl-CoA thioesterase-2